MATLRYGDHELPLSFTNHFLAHLQSAAFRRFAKKGGFFLTGTYDSDGEPITVSHWVHPGIPLVFIYDVHDDSGSEIPPVELDHKLIEDMLEAMERPVGVHSTKDVWLAFREKI